MKKSEIAAYGLAGLGQNIIYGLLVTYLLIFYTDVFGLLPAVVGTLFLIARIWDAMNDLIMATIVDCTRTRFGKLRPYLLFTPIPIAVFTILCFYAPDLSMTWKIVYAYVTYICWGMIYTINDVPYWGLSAAITTSSEERTLLISITRLLTMIGMGIPIIGLPLLIDYFGKGNMQQGYFISAVVLSIISMLLMLLGFFGTKEKIEPSPQKLGLIANLILISKNKPLLIILLSGLLATFNLFPQLVGAYFATYCLGDLKYMTLFALIQFAAMVPAMLFTPLIVKKFGKKNTFIYTGIGSVITLIIFYAVGYASVITVGLFLFVYGFFSSFAIVLQSAMIGDSVDYLEWKTNQRAEAVCFAGQTLLAKLSSAIAAFVSGIVLTYIGFKANAVQTDFAKQGIFAMMTIIPAIGIAISLVVMFFYKFTEDQHFLVVEEIKRRKMERVQ